MVLKLSKPLSWDEAKTNAEENIVFVFPVGVTSFTLANVGTVESGAFKGKYIVQIEVDGKRKRASIGAKQFLDILKAKSRGVIEFSMMRIGEGLQTRYNLEFTEPLNVKEK